MLHTVYKSGFGYSPLGSVTSEGSFQQGSREVGYLDDAGNIYRDDLQMGRVDQQGLVYRGDVAIGRVDKDGLIHDSADTFSPVGHVTGDQSDELSLYERAGAAFLLVAGSPRNLAPW